MSTAESTGHDANRRPVESSPGTTPAPERIGELVREILETGRTPDEVCAEEPHLLPAVREHWRRVARVRDQFDVLFPAEPRDVSTPRPPGNPALPQIPGYEVESVLGRGGMGIVFRARHLRLNRTVAIKMMLAGEFAAARERERFGHEAEAIARLRHPNIIQIFDVGDIDGRPYFTMEFMEGGSLSQTLQGTPYSPRQASALVMSLASAAESAHRAGIVHRDLKPGNVLLTAEKTPKIGDFGLARRLEKEIPLTQTGTAAGTPGYMAPEQVRGAGRGTCPPVDIYALGAILYELITGEPPFRADSAESILHRVLTEDPIPPSRRNPLVPRDLEIICLTCLEKEPDRRYASAGALEEDLRRFQAGEAILARAEGPVRTWLRRIRRKPIHSGVILASLMAAVVGWRLVQDRAAARRQIQSERLAIEVAAGEDLRQMRLALRTAEWKKAEAAFERAKVRLGDRATAEVADQLDRAGRNLAIVSKLEAIRLDRAESVHGVLRFAEADQQYGDVFETAGLGRYPEPAEAVAARVKESDIRVALLAALDDWAAHPADLTRRDWTLSIARLADDEAGGWTALARDPKVWDDSRQLRALVDATPTVGGSVALAVAIAERLDAQGEDPLPFLRSVQREKPADFWVNERLGTLLAKRGNDTDAMRYFQAAQVLRPEVSLVYNKLGIALSRSNRCDEAVEQFLQAIHRDPTSGAAHFNLVLALRQLGRHEEVLARLPEAMSLNAGAAILHSAWGDSLEATGRRTEAIDRYREATAKNPRLEGSQRSLRTLLLKTRRFEEAREAWSRYLSSVAPPEQTEWDGYAELCLDLGHETEYRNACRELLDRFGSDPDPRVAERIGRACLLLPRPDNDTPGMDDSVEQAAALIDRALADPGKRAPGWVKPYFLFAKGLAEYRQGHPEAAIAILEKDAANVLGPAPGLVLAMAEHSLGHSERARKALDSARNGFDWDSFAPEIRETWLYRILRREAESTLGLD